MRWNLRDDYQLQTLLDEKVVIQRIWEETTEEREIHFFFGKAKSQKMFEGKISGNSFQLRRIINYKNSFLPQINGTVQQDSSVTTISISSRLPLPVFVFLVVWTSFCSIGAIVGIISFLYSKETDPGSFIPLGMVFFGYILTLATYNYENERFKTELCRICKATIDKNSRR